MPKSYDTGSARASQARKEADWHRGAGRMAKGIEREFYEAKRKQMTAEERAAEAAERERKDRVSMAGGREARRAEARARVAERNAS